MSITEGDKFSYDGDFHITHIINDLNTGLWEYNISTREVKWSPGFYVLLGYEPGEIPPSYDYFFENLLYYDDKPAFLKSINRHFNDAPETIRVRLLTKQSGYRWFKSTAKRWDDNSVPKITGSIADIHENKLLELQSGRNDFLFKETIKIAKVGGWEIDVRSMTLTLSRETYEIYELQESVKLSIEEAISFFEPDHRQIMARAIDNIIKYSRPFDLELQFRTARNNLIWLRAKGIAVIDDYGKCITVRSIFQNIDYIKKKELEVQDAVNLLSDQNKRLQNFAYIVSHNLRSHTGNLQFMVDLFDQTETEDDRKEIFSHIKSISGSLNTTIEHLSEIVKIQAEIGKERKMLNLEDSLKSVLSVLQSNIRSSGAKVEYDFSEVDEVFYIPAYLESIFQNMITNSIKYRHPDRKPLIKVRSAKIRHHIYLYFEDNGLGIDLDKYGDSVFGMYKTFHHNPDAKGIGLFMTRNQVEALGGTIDIDSTVNEGTKFTVKLV
ncbi:PAS domain-containing sensor histidine kinase [Mucilaginibacter ginsenosidivorans]|uniref:histidine kinase n=1 Tax=Mucilaginibacter ginsenosidivorans TaxID=398053 RepID=A0A5B8V212_9SPHI|nr:HAMP domain-containing sensor histidine kinase [Mucilaginibacter ginsenosidivorans]QEC65189.1 PAS domain-containing protein [Mucilaginibacter ginsenosidivorans]